ncbi:hypothetical protein L202_03238 [Cryptococcus amylolentus CBS 6039]|uniref:Uncharacterized protein n=1 Tax=Cryptococcus amylolentus CBS 6039 TaxID=1295533 RepID=A0A1E3HZH9_9TREE|nr:hypothetical protein L202_03238 [Cryptococcus amylolentus CBS 6039]ODN81146.1 hypothetical protein L202_03238 [Cryptococcus amylolentus CBS 6039]
MTPEVDRQTFWNKTSRVTRRPGDAESTVHTMLSEYKDWLNDQSDIARTAFTSRIVEVQDAQQAVDQARTRTQMLDADTHLALSELQELVERGADRAAMRSVLKNLRGVSESFSVAVDRERTASRNLDHLQRAQAITLKSGWRMVKEADNAKTFGPSYDTALESWCKFAITCDCGRNPHDPDCLNENPTYWDKYMMKHSMDDRGQESALYDTRMSAGSSSYGGSQTGGRGTELPTQGRARSSTRRSGLREAQYRDPYHYGI